MARGDVRLISAAFFFFSVVVVGGEEQLEEVLSVVKRNVESVKSIAFISEGVGGSEMDEPPRHYQERIEFAAEGDLWFLRALGFSDLARAGEKIDLKAITTAAFSGDYFQIIEHGKQIMYLIKKPGPLDFNYSFNGAANLGVLEGYIFVGYIGLLPVVELHKKEALRAGNLVPTWRDIQDEASWSLAREKGVILEEKIVLDKVPCVVARFPAVKAYGIPTFFEVYFSREHNFFPIGWDWYFEGRSVPFVKYRADLSSFQTVNGFRFPAASQKESLINGGGPNQGKVFSRMHFSQSDVKINEPLMETGIFVLDPLSVSRIVDVERDTWIEVPK
jgi:hypothetical protein